MSTKSLYRQNFGSRFGTKSLGFNVDLDGGLEAEHAAPSWVGTHPIIVFDEDSGGISGEKDSAHAGNDMDIDVGSSTR